jgi:hypothetical protein
MIKGSILPSTSVKMKRIRRSSITRPYSLSKQMKSASFHISFYLATVYRKERFREVALISD